MPRAARGPDELKREHPRMGAGGRGWACARDGADGCAPKWAWRCESRWRVVVDRCFRPQRREEHKACLNDEAIDVRQPRVRSPVELRGALHVQRAQ
eukprot:655431-Alexandrium_andersonii.AAC.1